jgi:hypothetical protein
VAIGDTGGARAWRGPPRAHRAHPKRRGMDTPLRPLLAAVFCAPVLSDEVVDTWLGVHSVCFHVCTGVSPCEALVPGTREFASPVDPLLGGTRVREFTCRRVDAVHWEVDGGTEPLAGTLCLSLATDTGDEILRFAFGVAWPLASVQRWCAVQAVRRLGGSAFEAVAADTAMLPPCVVALRLRFRTDLGVAAPGVALRAWRAAEARVRALAWALCPPIETAVGIAAAGAEAAMAALQRVCALAGVDAGSTAHAQSLLDQLQGGRAVVDARNPFAVACAAVAATHMACPAIARAVGGGGDGPRCSAAAIRPRRSDIAHVNHRMAAAVYAHDARVGRCHDPTCRAAAAVRAAARLRRAIVTSVSAFGVDGAGAALRPRPRPCADPALSGPAPADCLAQLLDVLAAVDAPPTTTTARAQSDLLVGAVTTCTVGRPPAPARTWAEAAGAAASTWALRVAFVKDAVVAATEASTARTPLLERVRHALDDAGGHALAEPVQAACRALRAAVACAAFHTAFVYDTFACRVERLPDTSPRASFTPVDAHLRAWCAAFAQVQVAAAGVTDSLRALLAEVREAACGRMRQVLQATLAETRGPALVARDAAHDAAARVFGGRTLCPASACEPAVGCGDWVWPRSRWHAAYVCGADRKVTCVHPGCPAPDSLQAEVDAGRVGCDTCSTVGGAPPPPLRLETRRRLYFCTDCDTLVHTGTDVDEDACADNVRADAGLQSHRQEVAAIRAARVTVAADDPLARHGWAHEQWAVRTPHALVCTGCDRRVTTPVHPVSRCDACGACGRPDAGSAFFTDDVSGDTVCRACGAVLCVSSRLFQGKDVLTHAEDAEQGVCNDHWERPDTGRAACRRAVWAGPGGSAPSHTRLVIGSASAARFAEVRAAFQATGGRSGEAFLRAAACRAATRATLDHTRDAHMAAFARAVDWVVARHMVCSAIGEDAKDAFAQLRAVERMQAADVARGALGVLMALRQAAAGRVRTDLPTLVCVRCGEPIARNRVVHHRLECGRVAAATPEAVAASKAARAKRRRIEAALEHCDDFPV